MDSPWTPLPLPLPVENPRRGQERRDQSHEGEAFVTCPSSKGGLGVKGSRAAEIHFLRTGNGAVLNAPEHAAE